MPRVYFRANKRKSHAFPYQLQGMFYENGFFFILFDLYEIRDNKSSGSESICIARNFWRTLFDFLLTVMTCVLEWKSMEMWTMGKRALQRKTKFSLQMLWFITKVLVFCKSWSQTYNTHRTIERIEPELQFIIHSSY